MKYYSDLIKYKVIMKILIIKPSSFGDIIQANPLISAIKAEWAEAQIDWLVFDKFKPVIELFNGVTNIQVWERNGGIKAFFKILKVCNKENYDLVIDLQGLLRTALFAFLLKAKQKIGVSGMKELSWLLIKQPYKRNKKENAVIRNLNSLSYITGKKYSVNFELKKSFISDISLKKYNIESDDKFITLIPFARGKTKNWNIDYYNALSKMIYEKYPDIKIIILGAQKDFGKIKNENLIDLCGKTNIKELAQILSKSLLAIGADTGPMHLANAIGVKNIFIFGGSDVYETSPYGNISKVFNSNLPCSPCRGKCIYDTEKCLEQIKPEYIFESVEQWIK